MSKNKDCAECNSEDNLYFDPLGFGSLLDTHMDSEVNPEELGKRIADAMDLAKKLGSRVSQGLEDELAELVKPRLMWQDFVRHIKATKKQASSKNDWNSPKRKPLFAGLYVPKKIEHQIKFGILYDCSGSMRKEQISYGISQVGALSDRANGWAVPFDTEPYYDAMVRLRSASLEELKNAKYKGAGGTVLLSSLQSYEKEAGEVDLLFVISDFFLADEAEVLKWKAPEDTQVVWLSVAGNRKFKPGFGRKFDLMNE